VLATILNYGPLPCHPGRVKPMRRPHARRNLLERRSYDCWSHAWTTCLPVSGWPPLVPRRASSSPTGTSWSTVSASISLPTVWMWARELRIRPGSRIQPLVEEALDLAAEVPPWLELDRERSAGRVTRRPQRSEVHAPFDETQVIEFYSR
jgi:hypothetical protein